MADDKINLIENMKLVLQMVDSIAGKVFSFTFYVFKQTNVNSKMLEQDQEQNFNICPYW